MLTCAICNNTEFIKARSTDYDKCTKCGHELKNTTITDPFIINDPLSVTAIKKLSILDKFKLRISLTSRRSNAFLVDVGSSSGKFLYHIQDKFKKTVGIEITPSSVEFSKTQLNLAIVPHIQDIGSEKISLVTFWHSLEHIPFSEINDILKMISMYAEKDIRILVSVPNADALIYQMFGKKFAYCDRASHVHQFSVRSLDALFAKYNFVKEKTFFSFSYSIFGYLQTLVNLGNVTDNFLYFFLKRNREFGKNRTKTFLLFIYNVLLSGIMFLPALVGVCYELVYKKKANVLTVCYQLKV